MSIYDIHSGLVDLVESITPTIEPIHGFAIAEEANGRSTPLINLIGDNIRLFDLRVTTPSVDDKEAGFPRNRFRITFSLRIRYPADGDYTYTELMMMQDVLDISNTVIRPSNFPNKVKSILPIYNTTKTETVDANGNLRFFLLEIPLVVIYTL